MTKIAISLAAVLLLIAAIGYFAMRFLRADDSDDRDEAPAQRARPRGRRADGQDWAPGSQATVTAGRAGRGARGIPGPDAPARGQDQAARGRPARAASGSRPGARFGDQGPDQPGFDTGAFQNAGREGDRPVRGRISREFAANRASQASDQAPDDRGYGDRRFSFNPQDVDDVAGGGARGGLPSGARGWAASDAESTQVLAADSRPNQGRPDQDRPDQGRGPARSSVSSRSGRTRRSGEMSGKDWDSLSDVDYWAELSSDKSLAATAEPASPASRDKPTLASDVTAALPGRRQAAGGPPAAAPLLPGGPDMRGPDMRGPDMRGPDMRGPDMRGLGGSGRPGARGDRGLLADGPPARGGASGHGARRSRDLPAAPRDLPAAPYGGARARPPLTAAPDRDGVAAPSRLGVASGGRPPAADDDPLTSPSFPAVRDEDSRSYRSRRAAGPPADTRASGPRASGPRASGPRASGGYLPAGPPAAAGYPAAAADPLAGFDDYPSERGRRARADEYPAAYPPPPPPRPAPAGPPAAAPAARHRDYRDLPAAPPSTPAANPYGSYVSPAGSPPPPARPDSDVYGGYAASQETQRYGQPSGRHLSPGPAPAAPPSAGRGHPVPAQPPLGSSGPSQATAGSAAPGYPAAGRSSGAHAVPMYAAPVPSRPESAPGEYGRSWPAAPASPAAPAGPYGPPADGYRTDGDPAGGYGVTGYPAASYPAEAYGEPEYPAAAYSGRSYDQSAYLPEDAPGGQHDQNEYGSPDSGYGAGAYGGYPGY
jgi:hypothetical protein